MMPPVARPSLSDPEPGSIFRSAAAAAAVAELYARTRDALPFPTAESTVDTRLGPTHLLTAGPHDGPRVVFLQGGNVVNPITLAWLAPLADRLRLVAPDTPGQPGRSHPHRPADQEAYGDWVADVLDATGWPSATVVGVSQGAGVALRFAAHHGNRLDRLVLVVPAGIAASPAAAVLQLTLGYVGYRLTGARRVAAWVARRLTGGSVPPAALVDAIALSFGGTTLETTDLPLATAHELRDLAAPVLVLAGEHDPMFPPSRVLPRAGELFPHLEAAETVAGAGHILDAAAIATLGGRLASFLGLTPAIADGAAAGP